ncbi:SET domain-containing protein [Lophiostoma macrostomum CBS 122681]|uniref:SET domain-containing protein n=1 Tax=Lophiostoma macrostomum CBS 122681 TaxID=1314788 RepID=A0A6A6TB51_9PLEO|nr:SET domain-containing protein [Lophiostoma macrostomum CBS 122681]
MASQSQANTIFLTEQEAERIQTTVKERAKKCSELAGQTREFRDAKSAISQATGASLMADMGGAPDPDMADTQGQKAIPTIAVGQPYPPCIVSLQNLEPMKFTDLKMETHHRGKKLIIRRASPVVTLAARSWTMVQDEEEKETERLEMCLHKARNGEDVLESTRKFIIKEPYFTLTDQGEPTLRIDHPSDLVVCRGEEISDQVDATKAEKLATRFKNKGNSALKEQDLPEAYAEYTQGIEVAQQDVLSSSNPDLARDIFRNRAYINLLLNQLDEAITDAKASLTQKEDERSKSLDSKAYFRAGSAAYQLGDYASSRFFFESQLELSPGDKDATSYIRKIKSRLREQETGSYDYIKLRTGLSKAHPRTDAATFIGNTEVKNSPNRGNGLYATRAIPSGELVLADKAFCVVWSHELEAMTAMTYDVRDSRIRVSPVGLASSIVQKLLSNPSLIPRVMDKYGDWQGTDESKGVVSTNDGPVVDVFRVQDIMSRNAFGVGAQYGEEGARNASTGLFTYAAYINHSCIPNLKREFIGDLLVLRALRPLVEGEEIFLAYDENPDYDARQAALMTTWGFECQCKLCEAEKTDGVDVRKKRAELVKEAESFVEKEHRAGAKRLVLRRAQRLAKGIEETYEKDRYDGLPKRGLEGITSWLERAKPRA